MSANKKDLSENGFLVIPNVVPKALLDSVVGDITSLLEIPNVVDLMGMIELYHTQAMWDIRQYPALYDVFSSILETEKLWVSIDRVNYKKPNSGMFCDEGFIHWDICVNQNPRPFELQGVLALTDTDTKMGGFHCVPSLYKELDQWLDSLPTKKAIFSYFNVMGDEAVEVIPSKFPKKKLGRWKIEKVPVRAGDLIVWDSFLPHGNSPNLGKDPRFAQYVTMFPVGDERLREERIDCWKNNKIPSGYAFPGNPSLQSVNHRAELTLLGQKLLGIKEW